MTDPLNSKVMSPKHIPIPHIPQESAIVFETYMFAFTTVASFLQFLHLYRSVWWLPQSYTRYTMVRTCISFDYNSVLRILQKPYSYFC